MERRTDDLEFHRKIDKHFVDSISNSYNLFGNQSAKGNIWYSSSSEFFSQFIWHGVSRIHIPFLRIFARRILIIIEWIWFLFSLTRLRALAHICPNFPESIQSNEMFANESIYDTIQDVAYHIKVAILVCRWQADVRYSKCKPFVFTDDGLCSTFNALNSHDVYTDEWVCFYYGQFVASCSFLSYFHNWPDGNSFSELLQNWKPSKIIQI